MATSGSGGNVRLDGSSVWFDPDNPTQINVSLNDLDLVHPVTGKEGLILVASSNPRSANFDPKTFNTLRDLLVRFGKNHPAETADETIQRRFDRRFAVIGGTPPPRDPERPQDDPWDADAVRYVLDRLPGLNTVESRTRGPLMEHMRGQRRLDAARVARARALAAECGVECRPDPDEPRGTIHFFRTDPDAPVYPSSGVERRQRRRPA
jgi:hypothetical protein